MHRTKATFGEWVSSGLATQRDKESQCLKSGFSEGSFILLTKKKVTREAEIWQDGVKEMTTVLWYCGLALLPTQYQGKHKPHFLCLYQGKITVLELGSVLLLIMFCRNALQYSAECSNFVSSYKAPQICWRLQLTQIIGTIMFTYRLASSTSSSSHPVAKTQN